MFAGIHGRKRSFSMPDHRQDQMLAVSKLLAANGLSPSEVEAGLALFDEWHGTFAELVAALRRL
jgi:hypothetical protein